jgi:hypothetical protein
MTELYMGIEKIAESRVLGGAKTCQEKIEIYDGSVTVSKGEGIELIWPAS